LISEGCIDSVLCGYWIVICQHLSSAGDFIFRKKY